MECCKFIRLAAPGTPLSWIYNHISNLKNGLIHQCLGYYELRNFTTWIKDYPFKLTVLLGDDIDHVGATLTIYYTFIIRNDVLGYF
jgi:hypothetical protein